MTDDECWQIVGHSRAASGGDIGRQVELVVAQLRTRPLAEILRFNTWVRERMEAACLPYLLLAAEWVFGAHGEASVSGDTWEYFRGWLVALGRRDYEAALADPDVLADFFDEIETFGDGEPLEYAGLYAYWAAQGGEADLSVGPYAFRPPDGAAEPEGVYEPSLIEHFPARPSDNELTRGKLVARFPRLHRRFGELPVAE